MPYGEVISRSFAIFWRHKYLWLLGALGGGEASSGGGFGNLGNLFGGTGNGGAGTGGGGGGGGPDLNALLLRWLTQHLLLVAVLVALLVVFFVVYFFVSCVATPATVRAAAEHDAERPFDLRLAWRAGGSVFLSILGLRLLTLLIGFLVLALFVLLLVLGLSSAAAGQGGGVGLAIALGVLLLLALIPFGIGFGLTLTLATRAIVLEERGLFPALGRGFQLLTHRLGRVLLLWLIQIALTLALGLVLGVLSLALAVPLGVLLAVGYFGGGGLDGLLTAGAIAIVVYLIGVTLLTGAGGAYTTTYWTLAFRRLETETPTSPTYYHRGAPAA
jgi:hypothetical protein